MGRVVPSVLVGLTSWLAVAGCSNGFTAPSTTDSAPVSAEQPDLRDGVRLVTLADGRLTVSQPGGEVVGTLDLPPGFFPVSVSVIGRWLLGSDTRSNDLVVVDVVELTVRSIPLPSAGSLERETVRPGRDKVVIDGGTVLRPGAVVWADMRTGETGTAGRSDDGYFSGWRHADVKLYVAPDNSSSLIVPLDDPARWFETPGVVQDATAHRALVAEDDLWSIRAADGSVRAMRLPPEVAVGGALTPTGAITVGSGGAVSLVDFERQSVELLLEVGFGPEDAFSRGHGLLEVTDGVWSVVVGPEGLVKPRAPRVMFDTLGTECAAAYPWFADINDPAGVVVHLPTDSTLVELQSTRPLMSLDPTGCSFVAFGRSSDRLFVNGKEVMVGLDRVSDGTSDGTWVLGRKVGHTSTYLHNTLTGEEWAFDGGIQLLSQP